MNQVGRWLGALTVIGGLSIDAIEQEGTLDKPNNIDPVAWARYNASQSRTLEELSNPRPEGLDDFPARCECGECERCQKRHAEARAVVNYALAAALRGEDFEP